MNVTVQSQKFGDLITVTLDDGTSIQSPAYTDRISLATALNALSRQVMGRPDDVDRVHTPPAAEVLQK